MGDINNVVPKKGFFKNDRMFVCSMLAFYSVCTIGVIALLFWGLDRRNKTVSANATATGAVVATQNANVTATAVARLAEHDQYEFIERFNEVSGRWYVGPHAKQYGDASYAIKNGFYIWDVRKSDKFTYSSNFYKGSRIEDFDAYVDVKIIESESQEFVCPALVFRKSEKDFVGGAFVFSICNDSRFKVQYYDNDGWMLITSSDYSSVIYLDDWYRIEVNARGDRFVFLINHVQVFEMTDTRLEQGGLALFLEVPNGEAAVVWFDNFGFQSR